METIPKPECQKIGYLRKIHGVRGELMLEYDQEFEESVAQSGRFLVEIDGLLVPFFVAEDGLRFRSAKTALVTFDWVETEKYARRLVGCAVYLFNNEIISESEETAFTDLTDFMLLNENGFEIGRIAVVDDYAGNIVFTVNARNGEILIPYNDDLLLNLDVKQKTIQLQIPEGLLE